MLRLMVWIHICGADVVGQPGGWEIVVKYGTVERVLAARRGTARVFGRFETLLNYLKSIGITQFNVNASNYDPAHKRSRPDSSERLKRTFGAAEHDKWLREQVADAILQADQPNAVWIPQAEAVGDMQRQRAVIEANVAAEFGRTKS
jgi:hypothetical protein